MHVRKYVYLLVRTVIIDTNYMYKFAGPSDRVVKVVGLLPLAC